MNSSVARVRLARSTIGIGDARVSLNAEGGAVPLGLATQPSRWTRQVAVCRWVWRPACPDRRVRWQCAVGIGDASVSLDALV